MTSKLAALALTMILFCSTVHAAEPDPRTFLVAHGTLVVERMDETNCLRNATLNGIECLSDSLLTGRLRQASERHAWGRLQALGAVCLLLTGWMGVRFLRIERRRKATARGL